MTREEAKRYIIQHCNPDYPNGNTEWEIAMNMAIKALEQPEQRWIPVSERLPNPLQEVLVTSTRGYVYTSRIVHGDFEYGGNVIAWMPLPEPARLDGEADE